jgi:ABC-type cobalamin/Fe3+-siderophores transport system ATPase subunit
VIKLETAHIEEVRGIRKLDIDFRKEKFAISGPNGSGKSGVIDAIEFGLTGQIGRLTGRGTGGLSVAEHGPHVDKIRFPDASFVRLQVYLTELDKSVTITRKISTPKKPKIEPADDDVMAALAEVADHPEIALSRRDILRFILVEPTKRSEEIQTILKLDEIGQTRSTLNTTWNRLQRDLNAAKAAVDSSRTALQTHLQIATLRSGDVLAAVNQRRALLGLAEIAEMTADTKLDAGLSSAAKIPEFNKRSALRDLGALSDAARGFPTLAAGEARAIAADLGRLEDDPSLLAALQRHTFIEKGLDLVDGAECPLCDTEWEDEQHLRNHLTAKLLKSEEARTLQQRLLDKGAAISREIVRVTGLLAPVHKLSEAQGSEDFPRLLSRWRADIGELKDKLATVDGLMVLKDRLTTGWLGIPNAFSASLKTLTETVEAKPDQTATIDAQTFLTTAQLRLGDYREARRKSEAAEIALNTAKAAYTAYCTVMDDELNALYEDVQEDFSKYYRIINEDDESEFTARLTPSEGKLDFDVNFYERGLFPPGAFHSEGHQDGMGVCLYLALMKRLFGDRFTFALLDDVVMSVDAGHRYQFCKLLKTEFPDTQFIITTHDRLWAEQMKSAGLITRRTSLAFHGWAIDTGPLVESNLDIWDDIAASLAKGKVEVAAAALRHHLEYVSRHLADELGATVQFRADGNYELGDLLPPVLARMKYLLGKAADAAQSWGNNELRDSIAARRTALSNATGTQNVEQWVVNRAVHYNEWANFGRSDFEPVVAAFKELLRCFVCPTCESWFHITPPRGAPEALRCPCAATNLNLMAKVVTTARLLPFR